MNRANTTEPPFSQSELRIVVYDTRRGGWNALAPVGVRITHEPSGLVAACDDSPTVRENKATALERLVELVAAHYERQAIEDSAMDAPTTLYALCALVEGLADKADVNLEESQITAMTRQHALRPISMREALNQARDIARGMDKNTPTNTEAADAARWRYTLENPFLAFDMMRVHHSLSSPRWADEANAAVDAAIKEQQK